jgi:hypothetical protein
MNNAKVIKISATRSYRLAPYEQITLNIEVEVPDTMLSDDIALSGTYLECIRRMDASYGDIVNHYNSKNQNQNR